MILLFLDDERTFEDVTWLRYPFKFTKVVVYRNPKIFVTATEWYLRNVKEEVALSLDHDLMFFENGEEITGYTALRSIVDSCLLDGIAIPNYVFAHTQNPIGKKNIRSYHENALRFQTEQNFYELNRSYGA